MGPQQSSFPSYLSYFSFRLSAEMRAIHWVMAQHQARFRCCGETLASPKNLRVGVAFSIGVLNF
jgi:hypothetical protein